MGLLSILIGLPLVGMVLVLVLPARRLLPSGIALATSMAQLTVFLAGILPDYVGQLDAMAARGQRLALLEQVPWLRLDLGESGRLAIDYFLGLDGLNVLLVLLTLLIVPIAVVASRSVTKHPKAYFALILLLSAAMLGTFLAMDLFLFYICYELMLLPLFFLIGIWGTARGPFAAIKFFLFTLAGSIFMLLVLVGLYFSNIDPHLTALHQGLLAEGGNLREATRLVQERLANGELARSELVHSFNLLHLENPANRIPGSLFSQVNPRAWGFGALLFAFAIKLPAVPVHTWLPDAHVEASTPISVLLAGVLLKVGGYGLIRLAWGLFPEAAASLGWWIGLIAVVTILHGALNALAQTDLKRMIAYSSISHMGLVLLGLASLEPEGLNGAVFQLFNHGIITASLFLLVGMLYGRTGDRHIAHYEGLWQKMPHYTSFVILAFFAGLALPGFSTFVSELLVFAGAFASEGSTGTLPRWMSILAVLGIILTAAYFLRALRRMFFGSYRTTGGERWDELLTDLSPREWGMLLPLAALALLGGLMPHLFLTLIDDSLAQWVERVVALAGA